jgi:L-ascorbate metabolism protein UlaG (beta-lactamase superfamily)
MNITWLGHAAFSIEAEGKRIVTDPYSLHIGFAPINEAFDIVTLSHHNPKYHSCLDEILGEPQVLDGLEIARSGQVLLRDGLHFGAVEVAGEGENDDFNAMIWLETDGLRVLHMGDCGRALTPEQIEACGQVDVLLALAGAGPTLPIADLIRFIEALNPKLVLPMHYGVPQLKTMSLVPIEELESAFVARFGTSQSRRSTHSSLAIDAASLGDAPTLMILPAAR